MPDLCGGWLWFVGHWGGHPMLLVGRLWVFVGSCTHFMSWWVVVMDGCAPHHSWILTGGQLWLFVGGHPCSVLWWAVCGWLVQSFMGFETACDSRYLQSMDTCTSSLFGPLSDNVVDCKQALDHKKRLKID